MYLCEDILVQALCISLSRYMLIHCDQLFSLIRNAISVMLGHVTFVSERFHEAGSANSAGELVIASVRCHMSPSSRICVEHFVTMRAWKSFLVVNHLWQLGCSCNN